MKKEKVGITILILFITITTSINIVSLNKSSKLLGTVPSRNIDSNEVEYTSEKTVQGAINDLAEKANIIGTDEEKNKFRDDSKTIIGQIGTETLKTTSQNLIGVVNELGVVKSMSYDKITVPPATSKVLGTISLDANSKYLVFGWNNFTTGPDARYSITLGSKNFRTSTLGGGGMTAFDVIDTGNSARTVQYTIYHNHTSDLTATNIYLYAIKLNNVKE